jgi:hypothetical protein
MERKVILTPNAKNKKRIGSKKPDSRRDFEEQQRRTSEGNPWMWDDASFNQAHVGDVFGFVHNNSHVNYHVVTEVHSVISRLPSWFANIGQRNRQVLYLSKEVGRQSWGEWQEYGGYDKVQGTMYVQKKELKDCLLYLF